MGVEDKLKEIRMREYMLNQKEFCSILYISQSTYDPLENNIKVGNAETLLIIDKALNKKVENIWYLEEYSK